MSAIIRKQVPYPLNGVLDHVPVAFLLFAVTCETQVMGSLGIFQNGFGYLAFGM